MLELEQYKYSLSEIWDAIEEIEVSLDLTAVQERIYELEQEMNQEGFWNDAENAGKVLKTIKALKDKSEKIENLKKEYEDIEVLIELGMEAQDESVIPEVENAFKILQEDVESFRIETLLKGQYDRNNAIFTIHSGAGGLEAQDWAEMLLRMYTRWAEKKGYTITILDMLRDYEAGIKSATLLIEGENAYGYLKSEKGVHRLVRISPFDTAGKRHTSFASVDVMPELDDEVKVEIDEEDLKIDTYRSSGAGGQHVNKTDSAVRITHIPTGIIVQCQNERSQHSNKEMAMKMLTAKLLEIKEQEHKDKIDDIKGEYREIAWGSQIRSYVFHPYNMVKDHRTGEETGNTGAVMDGELDNFINAYLKQGNGV
ncbi:MAG TPA: peptide chain release factor 2 [Bacillota bacterium]|nr:peptide chain release factor 2 [Bacillota bacterium]HQE65716.1 peptide chain release factor 2 [Bacillota bacterium]HQI15339.1 peptide chain release factor 2 [Bacillota bacterium]HQJ36400.1 peptide chain release factor 2 [Bacillota bacterium]HQL37678.1 peptide chain release factor 2 [Bacillota bacterium]